MGAQGALYTMEHSARAEESQHVSQEAVKRDRAPSELSLTPTEILAAANRWRPGGKTAASIVEESAEIWRHRQNCSSGVGEAGNEVADNEVWFSGIWPGRGGGEIEEEDGRDWTWTYSTRHSSEGTSTYLRRKEKHKKKKKKEEEKKEEEKKEEEKKEEKKEEEPAAEEPAAEDDKEKEQKEKEEKEQKEKEEKEKLEKEDEEKERLEKEEQEKEQKEKEEKERLEKEIQEKEQKEKEESAEIWRHRQNC